jgi:leucyl-tRNA synthetase
LNEREFLEWLRSIEAKWQARWRENRIFEANPEPGKPKYFITVPYPYSNAPLHIGHGRTYTIGDIVARYKRLKGYNVLYPMAFHITGTPVLAVSEMISRGDERVVNMYKSYIRYYVGDEGKVNEILESFKNPLNLAVFFAERIQSDFDALGYSIDWRRKFHTGEPIYNKFVTWQYYKLNEKGLITMGDHIVTYCLLHNQPEGEDDIQDADVNPVEILEYTAVKFLEPEWKVYLVAATLRPETIYGVTNLWVNPNVKYLEISFGDEVLIVSEKAYVKLVHQHPEKEIRVLREIPGKGLVGRRVVSPLGKEVIVLPAEFVDPDNATGVVYSEPSDAPYDYVALQELKAKKDVLREYGLNPEIIDSITPIKIIDVPGLSDHHAKIIVEKIGIRSQIDERLEEVSREVYREQYYNGVMIVDDPLVKGLTVKEAREVIRKRLIDSNQAFIFYELNRKAKCRSGGEIIVAKIKGQWFLNYGVKAVKERVKKYIEEELVVIPEKYRKAFLDTVDWLDKRPCARKRGIGTPLPWSPDWIIESLSDSTIYMAFYTIVHKIREYGIKPESLTPELFDYVFLGIGDPVDVSSKTSVPLKALEEMRSEFMYWYPVDHRHTSIPHISNHLSFYIFHHIVIFPREHWPRMITLNETVIREGAKMSKSKGNVIPLRDIARLYSADLFRLYISWAAGLDSVLDWREKEVAIVVDSLKRFVELAENAVRAECRDNVVDDVVSRWFMDKFYQLVSDASNNIEHMEIREYVQNAFFNVLSLIDKYRDIVGDSYLCSIKQVLRDWITVLNPVIPHVTEEINELMGGKGFLSKGSWPTSREARYPEITMAIDNALALQEDIREILGLVKGVPGKIYIIVAPEWKREIAVKTLDGIQLREIMDYMRSRYGLKGREVEIAEVYNYFKKQPNEKVKLISSSTEFNTYMYMVQYYSRKFNVDVEVLWEDDARVKRIPKSEKALPLKPSIYVELIHHR